LTDRIFAAFAPTYWAAGLPVIPLRERNKMPDINQWSIYGSRMPSEIEQQHWLASFPRGNIGLPFGPASGLCAIDIDTEDQALVAAILDILPATPWVRVGKKGMGLIYLWEGQKNFKLRGADGGMICEFLGMGNQMVMPPSIHPETQMPYTANANLWEVVDKIQPLGEDIEDKLRALLGQKGFEIGGGGRSSPLDVIPSGERDVMMVRHAGYLARVVLGIDRSAQFTLFDAIQQMYHWVEAFTAKVSGDAMDPQKGVAKLLEFLIKDLEKGRTMPEGWDAGLPQEWLDHPTIQSMQEMNATQRWTVNKARQWLGGKIAEKPEDADWVLARIGELLGEVAKDDQFREIDLRALITYIINVAGKDLGLKKSDLLIVYKDAKKQGESSESENHALIARIVLEDLQRSGEIRHDQGQFWQWNGSCFARLDEDTIYMHVANNVKDSMIVRRHSDYKAVVEVLERMCKGMLVQVEERGINFANGFVGEDLYVADHDPKYGATFTLPFNYDRDNATRCNKWLEFLYSCWGAEPDFEDRVAALQEMFAVTLFGITTTYQRAFLMFGRAGTGKTQILNVLRAMLPPDAAANLGPQLWGERFSLTDLIGKTANIVGELPENGLITGNVFKEVVEGSPQRTEFKGQDGFVFFPKAAQWFASNYLPVSRDTSRGFLRRWLILDFNRVIPENEQIKDLADILVAEEREAIAAWALEGLRRVLDQNGYTLPACHHKRTGQMRRINNSVQAFLEDASNIRLDQAGEMKCRELYDLYGFHMRDVGRSTPVSFERFMQMLEDLDLTVDHRIDPTGTTDYVVVGVMKQDRLAVAA
jgi:P4 family phage/plasmid primase-like protien